ncbi:hypothetical protein LXL04_028696 [Taraxacum kok-saghyz]
MESNIPPPKMGTDEKQVREDGNHKNTSHYKAQDTRRAGPRRFLLDFAFARDGPVARSLLAQLIYMPIRDFQSLMPHKEVMPWAMAQLALGLGRPCRRAISTIIVVIIILAGITAGVLWIVYHPHKPKFTVISAAVYALNVSSPPYISITMQFTIVTRNPNNHVSIYYDHLAAFLFYKNQAVTTPLVLPPLYHERDSTVSFSPILGGGSMAVSADVVNGLGADESYGVVSFGLVLTGKLRWKYGDIRSGRKAIHVGCDVSVVGINPIKKKCKKFVSANGYKKKEGSATFLCKQSNTPFIYIKSQH